MAVSDNELVKQAVGGERAALTQLLGRHAPTVRQAVAKQIIDALGVNPAVPEITLGCGGPRLLEMTMAQASEYYGVSSNVIPKRIRKTLEEAVYV